MATEVRALAQRSSDAAKAIRELIQKSSQRVSESVELVGETGKLLTTIVDRIGTINTSANEIARSAEEQATTLSHVNGSVVEMDQVTQKNAAMVEETSAASRSLAHEAEALAELVSRFSVKATNVQSLPSREATFPAAGQITFASESRRAQAHG